MSELMRGLLAERMQEEGMSPNVPVSVAELHRSLLPYPMCRDRLGYASKAEYDVDLLELLSDTRSVDVPEAANWIGEAARFWYRKSVLGGDEFTVRFENEEEATTLLDGARDDM